MTTRLRISPTNIYLGRGTAPGGLIEGIADYVRLRAGFAPPHWKPGRGQRWDEGYEVTGYFLNWIENKYEGFVRGINAILKDANWDEGMFNLITGKSVDELWKEYRKELDQEK
jgi:Peptidase of plants and bacteria